MKGPGNFVRDVADGFLSVFRGLSFILRTRRAWLPSAVPALFLVVLSVMGLVVAMKFVAPAVVARVPLPESSFGRVGAAVLRVLVAVVTAGVGAVLAATFAPVLSGPALEKIVLLREEALGVPARAKVSLFIEIWCGLRAQLVAWAIGGPVIASLWLLTILFPPAAVVTFPLKAVVALSLLVWTLLDYPLSLRGVRLGERVRLLGREAPRVLGFGVGVGVLFAVPLGAIILLPAAVAAATELGARASDTGQRERDASATP